MNSPNTYYFIQDQVYDKITNIIERAHAQFAGAMPVTNYVNLCRAQWHEYKPLKLNCNNELSCVYYWACIKYRPDKSPRMLPFSTHTHGPCFFLNYECFSCIYLNS